MGKGDPFPNLSPIVYACADDGRYAPFERGRRSISLVRWLKSYASPTVYACADDGRYATLGSGQESGDGGNHSTWSSISPCRLNPPRRGSEGSRAGGQACRPARPRVERNRKQPCLSRGSAVRLSCTSRATPRLSPPCKKAAPEECRGERKAPARPTGRLPAPAPAGANPLPDKKGFPQPEEAFSTAPRRSKGLWGAETPFTSRIRCFSSPGSRSRESDPDTPAPSRCAWRYPWPESWCPRRSRPRA